MIILFSLLLSISNALNAACITIIKINLAINSGLTISVIQHLQISERLSHFIYFWAGDWCLRWCNSILVMLQKPIMWWLFKFWLHLCVYCKLIILWVCCCWSFLPSRLSLLSVLIEEHRHSIIYILNCIYFEILNIIADK